MSVSEIKIEESMWLLADRLRGSMDPSEYKNIVLGLIFLKYISETFEERYDVLKNNESSNEEEKSEYISKNIFWVPQKARWDYITKNAENKDLGKIIDNAMSMIEKENPSLKDVLPKDFAKPQLNASKLRDVIDLLKFKVSDADSQSKDILGRIYEYFLSKFASAEGKAGGEFYTPRSVVKLLVEMLKPCKGNVYDPCCGSGGLFVQSERFIEDHKGKPGDIRIFGQESNPTTWRMCKMNLALRGIDGDIGNSNADTFHNDLHKDLKADYILANPPFNISDWGGEKLEDDSRWVYGIPPRGNANYAWIQHIISKLSDKGRAGFVMANGSLSTKNILSEYEIRKNLIENDLIDCIVLLPAQMFYSTQIPVCLWFLSNDKIENNKSRKGEILFIDAGKKGFMADRIHKEFAEDEIHEISRTYHSWRGSIDQVYKDIQGYCKVETIENVIKNDYVLTPGRFVGVELEEEETELYDDKMKRLTKTLNEQFTKSHKLEEDIKRVLGGIGYEI
ncbi:type I restriction-modification system subunit M [Metaclostridioides mangenotii]|uniref:class I SAM-dependent DNA methyltransferase n=1 Tax=Metaclostridioides mangenotii TaxID=1540 RepID=UPI000487EBC8|nr:class I SAM-dependent DNA methyltransferase [Clostridioides mangenotii]